MILVGEKQLEGCAPSQLGPARTALTEQRPPAEPYRQLFEDTPWCFVREN